MKRSIVREIAAKNGMTQEAADKAFEIVTAALKTVIVRDGSARVPNLGTFNKKFVAGRLGRNPSTGKTMEIAGRDVIKFKMAKDAI